MKVECGVSFGPSLISEGQAALTGFSTLGGPLAAPSVGGEVGNLVSLSSSVPINRFGAELVAPSLPILNERPVGNFSWEDFKPMATNHVKPDPAGIIEPGEIFNLNPTPVAAEVGPGTGTLLGVEPLLGEAPQINEVVTKEAKAWSPRIVREAIYWYTDIPFEQKAVEKREILPQTAIPLAVPSEQEYPSPQIVLSPATSSSVKTIVLTQPKLEEEMEEAVIEEATDDESRALVDEEIRSVRRKYVVDDRALWQVVVEFKEAIAKAKESAKNLGIKLTGSLIGKFLPGQHPGNESEVVKGRGPDGSIPERQQDIETLGEFSSDEKAEEKVIKIAFDKPPIKIRIEGKPVRDEDVQRVHKGYFTKPKPILEVKARIIKKIKQSGEVVETPIQEQVSEGRIEDHQQLSEVFQKAT